MATDMATDTTTTLKSENGKLKGENANTVTHAPQATKIMQDGQLYILYNNEYYTILGNKISKQ